MKKTILAFLLLAVIPIGELFAWGKLGHETIIAVAQRHLNDKAKENISRFISYDLKEDAIWMDIHRNDKPVFYTTHWHACWFDKDFNYDPFHDKMKVTYGDVYRALTLTEAGLNNNRWEHMDTSDVVYNIRILIHAVGDMHCPVHVYFDGGAGTKWGKCTLNGKTYKDFHTIYDVMPELIWGDANADSVAGEIDDASRREIRKITKGTFLEWLSESARRGYGIYTWNAERTAVLRDDTVELSRELVNLQMRDAGYRLAYLLNKYFGQ